MVKQRLRLVIDSDLENVAKVGTTVQSLCVQASFSEIEAFHVQLAMVEAINNVIKHAYGDQSGHDVTIDISVDADKLVFVLTDTGKSMPPFAITPSLEFDPDDLDAVPEGGMGLFIIHSVMDKVDYQACDGRNVQTFVKHLPSAKSA